MWACTQLPRSHSRQPFLAGSIRYDRPLYVEICRHAAGEIIGGQATSRVREEARQNRTSCRQRVLIRDSYLKTTRRPFPVRLCRGKTSHTDFTHRLMLGFWFRHRRLCIMSSKRTLRSSTGTVTKITATCPTQVQPTNSQLRKQPSQNARVKARRTDTSSLDEATTPPLKRARVDPLAELQASSSTLIETSITPSKDHINGFTDTTNVTASFDRPAVPHRTNAPLITPRGSRLLAISKDSVNASPSKTGVPPATTTMGHILKQACAHLIQQEPKLQPLIEKHYCRVFSPEGLAEECDPFKSLCSGIMAQQVSGAAASSIKSKFIALFHPSEQVHSSQDQAFPTPWQVASCTVPFLRQAGLSERKAEYIKGLAEKFASGDLSATMLIKASDEEVLEKLTAVRGLGRWSVEMFACFGLKRTDILSTGDLGVQCVCFPSRC